MNYSIIIPAYNAEATIAACLQALTQQAFDEPYEILVVDSSRDATPHIIRQHFPQVTLLHVNERLEPGPARNLGIQRAQGAVLCFLDSDCLPAPDWLARIVAAHRASDCAGVGGAVANGNPECLLGWAGYFAEFREFFPFHPAQYMLNIPTCNVSYKRRVFEQYGGFPDLLPLQVSPRHPQQEDFAFNLILAAHNERIFFDPAIRVAHINMTTIPRYLIHQYRIGRSTSPLMKRFPSLPGARIARSRMLSILAAPVLPCVKFIRTLGVATGSREYFKNFLLISPLLFMGLLFFWGTGFARGAFLPVPHVTAS